jgi:hypothetical protein
MNFSPYVGALIDLNYYSMGIDSGTLASIGVPGGGVHVFSRRLQLDMQPVMTRSLASIPAAAPGALILASSSVNKPGLDAGAGMAFGSVWHGKFFAEAKYSSWVNTIPTTFRRLSATDGRSLRCATSDSKGGLGYSSHPAIFSPFQKTGSKNPTARILHCPADLTAPLLTGRASFS